MFKKIAISFSISFLTLMPIASTVDATDGVTQLQDNLSGFGRNTGLGKDADLKTKIAGVINIVLGFLGMLATIMIIYAGFKWLTAAGNEEQVTHAKATLRNAVIGIVVIFLSFVIVNFTVMQLTDTVGGGGGGGGGDDDVVPPGQEFSPRYDPEDFQESYFASGRYKWCDVGTPRRILPCDINFTVCSSPSVCNQIDNFDGACTEQSDTQAGDPAQLQDCRAHFISNALNIYPE